MTDQNVVLAERFIKSYNDLFKEINKIIIGQDQVVKNVNLYFFRRTLFDHRGSWFS